MTIWALYDPAQLRKHAMGAQRAQETRLKRCGEPRSYEQVTFDVIKLAARTTRNVFFEKCDGTFAACRWTGKLRF